jgi:hypothetical protein
VIFDHPYNDYCGAPIRGRLAAVRRERSDAFIVTEPCSSRVFNGRRCTFVLASYWSSSGDSPRVRSRSPPAPATVSAPQLRLAQADASWSSPAASRTRLAVHRGRASAVPLAGGNAPVGGRPGWEKGDNTRHPGCLILSIRTFGGRRRRRRVKIDASRFALTHGRGGVSARGGAGPTGLGFSGVR